MDTKHLLGLIDKKDTKDEFSYEDDVDDDTTKPEANGDKCKVIHIT